MLRWKRLVQGDEDRWLANTRIHAVDPAPVRVDSRNFEDIRPKAAHGVIGALGRKLAIGLTRIDMIEPDASAVVLDQHARPIALTETRWATLLDIRRPSVMSARF